MSEKQPDMKAFAAKLAEIGRALEGVQLETEDRAEAVFHDLGRDLKEAARILGHQAKAD